MFYYEPKVRLKQSSFLKRYDHLIAYRNAAWMLASFAETIEEKQAIRNLPVEPNLFESVVYTRLVERMRTFFRDVFCDPRDSFDEGEEGPEFSFYTFHATYDDEWLYEGELLYILYRLLTGWGDDETWVVKTGIDYGFSIPDTLPPEICRADYVERRIRAVHLDPHLKRSLLSLFHALNLDFDNPFICIGDEVPCFQFYWGSYHFSIKEFEQLKLEWMQAKPLIDACFDIIEIFRTDETLAMEILKTVWRSIFIAMDPVSSKQFVLPFDPPVRPVWMETGDEPSDDLMTCATT